MACPTCARPMVLTPWRPKPGQDPLLRLFKCPKHQSFVYRIVTDNFLLRHGPFSAKGELAE